MIVQIIGRMLLIYAGIGIAATLMAQTPKAARDINRNIMLSLIAAAICFK